MYGHGEGQEEEIDAVVFPFFVLELNHWKYEFQDPVEAEADENPAKFLERCERFEEGNEGVHRSTTLDQRVEVEGLILPLFSRFLLGAVYFGANL